MSPDHRSTLHVKAEHARRAARRARSCRQQSDAAVSPQFVRGEGREEPPSHLYRILTVEHTADIKAEPDGDEFLTSLSTREAEPRRGIHPESCGLRREALTGEERTR